MARGWNAWRRHVLSCMISKQNAWVRVRANPTSKLFPAERTTVPSQSLKTYGILTCSSFLVTFVHLVHKIRCDKCAEMANRRTSWRYSSASRMVSWWNSRVRRTETSTLSKTRRMLSLSRVCHNCWGELAWWILSQVIFERLRKALVGLTPRLRIVVDATHGLGL